MLCGRSASKGARQTCIHTAICYNLFVAGKENRRATPHVLRVPTQPWVTASPCLSSPDQRDASSFGSEITLTASAGCSENMRDVPMTEQGKLSLSLIPTGYNIRGNEDRMGNATLAGKQAQGLLSQRRFSKLRLKELSLGLPAPPGSLKHVFLSK